MQNSRLKINNPKVENMFILIDLILDLQRKDIDPYIQGS